MKRPNLIHAVWRRLRQDDLNMKLIKATFLVSFIIFLTQASNAQTPVGSEAVFSVRSSAAYAEIMSRRTSLQADLEALLLDYKEEFPRVRMLRREIAILDSAIETLMKLPISANGKMTATLGKLIVKRAELETESAETMERYGEGHPEVRRARKRVEVFDRSIREILD